VIRSPYWPAFKGSKGPWDPQSNSIADFTWYSAKYRQPPRRRFLIALVVTCLAGFASPFALAFILDWLSTTPKRAEPAAMPIQQSASAISICRGWARRATCLVDGDTGWENGVKWRLSDVDTPEIKANSAAFICIGSNTSAQLDAHGFLPSGTLLASYRNAGSVSRVGKVSSGSL